MIREAAVNFTRHYACLSQYGVSPHSTYSIFGPCCPTGYKAYHEILFPNEILSKLNHSILLLYSPILWKYIRLHAISAMVVSYMSLKSYFQHEASQQSYVANDRDLAFAI